MKQASQTASAQRAIRKAGRNELGYILRDEVTEIGAVDGAE